MLRHIPGGRRRREVEEGGAGGEDGEEGEGSIKKDPAVWFLSLLCPSTHSGCPCASQRLESGALKVSAIQMWQASVLIFMTTASTTRHSPRWACPAVLRMRLMALPLTLGNFSLRSLRKLVHVASLQFLASRWGRISVSCQLSAG